MLFNSYEFLFFFLPAAVAVFFLLCAGPLAARGGRLAGPDVGVLLRLLEPPLRRFCCLASVAAELPRRSVAHCGAAPVRSADQPRSGSASPHWRPTWWSLGYFKYANFFVDLDRRGRPGSTLPLAARSCCRSASRSSPSPRSRFWSTPTRARCGSRASSITAVRHLFPAPDRRAGAASRGDDAAVRATPRPIGSQLRELSRSGSTYLRHRPVQEGHAGRRHPALRRPRSSMPAHRHDARR